MLNLIMRERDMFKRDLPNRIVFSSSRRALFRRSSRGPS
jgi:hypothetical protein